MTKFKADDKVTLKNHPDLALVVVEYIAGRDLVLCSYRDSLNQLQGKIFHENNLELAIVYSTAYQNALLLLEPL